MAQQTINVGAAPNDGTGTPLRTAFQYTNSNFTELYTAVGPSGNNIVVPGNATITGDLTVDTSTLKVDSANNRVGIGTATPLFPLDIISSGATTVAVRSTGAVSLFRGYAITDGTTEYGQFKQSLSSGELQIVSGNAGWGGLLTISTNGSERYRIANDGVATWSNVGGVAGTAMTLNSTGLGVGVSPGYKLDVAGSSAGVLRLVNINNLSTDPAAVTRLSIDGQGATWHLDNERTNGIFKITRNSTACLTIDNLGNVGIGVASPTSQLTVGSGGTANPAATVAFHKSTSDEYRLKLTSSTFNAAGKWIGLGLGYSSDYMKMAIIAEAKDTNARGNLYFALNGDATSANASIADAKMTLKSTGQVRFVPLAADPAGAEAGDVYYNSTSNKLKCYNGTTWNDLF